MMEEQLSNAAKLFGKLWEISVDGMRLVDEDGNILMVNDSFCNIFQMEKKELVGQPFSIVYFPDEQEPALETFLIDIRNNKLKTLFERENTLWNGRKAWFEFSNSFLTLNDGKKITLSIIKEISERKKLELELKENEKKFKMLFNSTNDAVFVTELSRNKTYGDFIEVNDIACKRLGYSKEEFLNLSPSAIISPKYMDVYNSNTDKLIKDGFAIYDIVHRAKDKKLIHVEVNSRLFLFNERTMVISTARDITGRKRAEENLKRSNKLLRELAIHLQSVREEERGMIAREIHDELGQVLTVLKIQVSLLANKLNEEKEAVKGRINLLEDMIDKSVESVQKISSKLRPGILDELGLIAAIEWQTEEFEKMTNIKCSLVLPKEEIKLDPDKSTAIFRIFQEALTNVARHSEAEKVNVSLLNAQASIHLEVKDNGKGITPVQIKDYKSLGIHSMEERALVFGGEVLIDGFPGKGTIVKVEIPIDR